jgi:hypothetical protein
VAAHQKIRTPVSLRHKHNNTIFITHGENVMAYPTPDPLHDPWLHALRKHREDHQEHRADRQRMEAALLMDRFDRKIQRAEENHRAQLRSRGNKCANYDLKVDSVQRVAQASL